MSDKRFIEIKNVTAMENRRTKNEEIQKYDICDYLESLCFIKTPHEDYGTYRVLIRFEHSSSIFVEYDSPAEAQKLYNDLKDYMTGNSEVNMYDLDAYKEAF